MSNSITQDMAFRQSLMQYAQKYGVSRASRKYNKSRSYIYFWKKRWDGSVASLACASRRPHSHPNQHTEDELKLIRDMRRRNPKLGMLELWHRLRQRGYSRCPESLFRVMRKLGLVLLRAQQDIFRSGHSRAAGVSVPDIAVRGKTGRRGAVHAAVRADHKRSLRAQRIEMPPAAAGHRAKNQGCLCSQSRISFAAS